MELVQTIVTIIIILLIFWVADSQRKNQNKKLKEVQDNVKVNDEIITYSGLSGKISKVMDDKVVIKANPSGVEISIEKWAIAGVNEQYMKKDSKKTDGKKTAESEDEK
jgi:preprotein translocase YajC subunit